MNVSANYEKILLTMQEYQFVTCKRYSEMMGTGVGITDKFCAIRHDVDRSLEKAFELARWESARGIRSTYFILHTAAYFDKYDCDVPIYLKEMQDMGHEIGFHNNLLALHCLNVDTRGELLQIMEWFKAFNIDVSGTTPHGGFMANKFRFSNGYIWKGYDAPKNTKYPNDKIIAGRRIDKLNMTSYFNYNANRLKAGLYWFDNSSVDLYQRLKEEPVNVVLLLHPCHWMDGGKYA